MSGGRNQTNSFCERCRRYQQEINELQARIFALESEKGLHKTLPVTSGGKKPTVTFSKKGEKPATFILNLSDTVSFPKFCKDQNASSWRELGAKPKQHKVMRDNVNTYVTSPKIQLTNRFLPLSETEFNVSNEQRENGLSSRNWSHKVGKRQQADRQSGPNVKVRDTLLIGDGAISGINHGRIQTCCCPSATVSEITTLLPKVLSTHRGVKQLIVHVGAVDIRKEQTEVLKRDFTKFFKELDKVEVKAFISGPLPNIDRKINKFSRLLQLNTWLSKECAHRGLHYIENFYLFWKREDLFKGKGPHLCRGGRRVLTEHLLHALRHQNGPGQGPERPVREKRNERSISVAEARDRASVSAPAAPQQPPPPPAKDSAPAPQQPPLPPVKDSGPPSVPPPPGPSSQALDSSVTAPAEVSDPAAPPSPPLPTDQPWAPPATSTPSRDLSLSLSFSSGPSPKLPPARPPLPAPRAGIPKS
uniref:wiskott-Aldrich syndrome protein family member 2-like n=2 Tax=Epinephelus lanceolatus TaxID=310571 RepID=UPI0014474ABE|nr:wiskott-Aldrich syndrome protein family member 2-like [Epinephelus lanceolatus]XP_033500530.1 wiskott-Aldrich syndrome protein family member 2-like [Epinephelus lanceolatus]